MNIISFHLGVVVRLFRTEAFAPLHVVNERQIFDAICERYQFASAPDVTLPQEAVRERGLTYEAGVFATKTGDVNISKFSIHTDGLVVRAGTTTHAEAFLEDIEKWLIETFEFRKVPSRTLYSSDIVVDFEKPMARLVRNFESITKIVLPYAQKDSSIESAAFGSLSIEFQSNKNSTPKFIIERRVDADPNIERFYCSAPMTTEDHILALEQIEALVV